MKGYTRYISLDTCGCVPRILTTTSIILEILHLLQVLHSRSKRGPKYCLPVSCLHLEYVKRAFWAITVSRSYFLQFSSWQSYLQERFRASTLCGYDRTSIGSYAGRLTMKRVVEWDNLNWYLFLFVISNSSISVCMIALYISVSENITPVCVIIMSISWSSFSFSSNIHTCTQVWLEQWPSSSIASLSSST